MITNRIEKCYEETVNHPRFNRMRLRNHSSGSEFLGKGMRDPQRPSRLTVTTKRQLQMKENGRGNPRPL